MIVNVYKEDMGVATGITYLYRTTGQVLGVSLGGSILQVVLLHQLREKITGPDAAQIIVKIRQNTDIIPTLDPLLRKAAVDSYADALRVVFIFQAVLSFLGFLCCLPIQESVLPGTREEQEQHYRNQENGGQQEGRD